MFSFEELLSSDTTAYLRGDTDAGDHSVYVRLDANDVEVDEDPPVVDLLADFRASSEIVVNITGTTGNTSDAGSREISDDLIAAIADTAPRADEADPVAAVATAELAQADFVLERYESTSDTTDITDDMMRWSDTDAWDSGVPGAGDTVYIGAGQTIILDQNVDVKSIVIDGG